MDKNPNLIQRSKNFIINTLGGNVVTNTDDVIQNEITRVKIGSDSYTKSELSKLQNAKVASFNNTNVAAIKNYFDNTVKESTKISQNFEKYSILTPEIKKARKILIPSIMSPNDLQSDGVSVTVEIPELSAELNKSLTDYLNNYFVDDLDLADKITTWVDKALFEKGSQPVLILPKSSITLLSNVIDLEKEMTENNTKFSVGMESLNIESKMLSEENVSYENFSLFNTADITELVSVATEAIENEIDKPLSVSAKKELSSGVKGTMEAVREKVNFTTDFRAIKSPKEKVSTLNKNIIKKINESVFGGGQDRLYVMPQEDELSENDHPLMIEIPAEAVIPITVPGAKETHIGYFVMIDEWGNVLNKAPQESDCLGTKKSNNIAKVLYNYSSTQLTKESQYDVASAIFGLTVKKMVEDKLNNVDIRNGLSADQYQAISTTLFQRVLDGSKVTMLFVPSVLMGYLAFDYRSNGTGKGMLEDGDFIISMRNNLMIANTMAAMKNAIDNKTISFNIGEEATNPEQLLKMAHDIFVSKKMFRFGHDPMSIAKNIVENSISVVPRGMKGMPDFEVTTERNSNNVTAPDSEIMDTMSKWIVTMTGVPYAALNELGENEFSRSIATTNLFFSNDIRLKQKDIKKFATKICRQYVSTSSILLEGIKSIIVEGVGDKKLDIKPDEVVMNIVKSIKVTLPTPSVSASSAQYEELNKILEIIEKITEVVFEQDMVVLDDDPDPKDSMNALKAVTKRNMMLSTLGKLGINNLVPSVDLTDIDQTELKDINQYLLHLTKLLKDMKSTLQPEEDDI